MQRAIAAGSRTLGTATGLAGAVQMTGAALMAPHPSDTSIPTPRPMCVSDGWRLPENALATLRVIWGMDDGVFHPRQACQPLRLDADGQPNGTATVATQND